MDQTQELEVKKSHDTSSDHDHSYDQDQDNIVEFKSALNEDAIKAKHQERFYITGVD